MAITIALAGNPNCGKTTMFNALTGSNQYVGNWPGVTVEKKEGKYKRDKSITITDLPGIYSLSPYTLEEVVSRNYLLQEKPDVILNMVDATNLERNLFLTLQLREIGIPVVIALNMSDLIEKNGLKIDSEKLEELLNCKVVETSALKGSGIEEAVAAAVSAAKGEKKSDDLAEFSGELKAGLTQIKQEMGSSVPAAQLQWYAVKLFEQDKEAVKQIDLSEEVTNKIEQVRESVEKTYDDDAESIVTNQRYEFIEKVVKRAVKKSNVGLSTSDKIDKVVTNRFLALPIFALVMFCVYFVSVSSLGAVLTDWANDGVFGDGWHLVGIGAAEYEGAVEEWEISVEELGEEQAGEEPDPAEYGVWVPGIPVLIESGLEAANSPDWLSSLVLDGIVGGVGAVLGFVPQMLLLFLFLAILESCGYMARIAFILDRIFRRFGLSGKSFIPMLIGSGCSVPGIMASKTIENEKDRRMTVITTSFIPCGAKLPVIALIGGAMFPDMFWLAPLTYFIGVAAVIFSGVVLKKTRGFAGDPAPFVMELPQYHIPAVSGVLKSMWERGRSFIIKAGTIIFLASAVIWFLSNFGFENGSFGMVEQSVSMIAAIGSFIAPIFAPLGFGNWEAAVATFMGLIAKENVVSTFGVLLNVGADVAEDDPGLLANIAGLFPYGAAAMSFLVFNLLCAPCFAAIGAIRREMNSGKWTAFAIAYQTVLAYCTALVINQIGGVITGGLSFGISTVIAGIVAILMVFALVWPGKKAKGSFPKIEHA